MIKSTAGAVPCGGPLSPLHNRLNAYRDQDYYRARKIRAGQQGVFLEYQNKKYLNFCSNDYLNLANHPEIIKALQIGAEQYGFGSGASSLITGYCDAHFELEQAFAEFLGYERGLLFGSGMLANLGIITALMKRQDVIFADKLNHASLIDAVKLSGAAHYRYAHANIFQLTRFLKQYQAEHKAIVSDSVFSMGGDLAPLPELSKLAYQHDATLIIDDAHGFGILGASGKGSLEHFNLKSSDVSVLVCPLGKAIGGYGAMVLGSHMLIENLIQFARTLIYTTALPPAFAVAMLKSLHLLQQEQWRREKLNELIDYFKKGAAARGLNLLPSHTPIQSLVIGSAQDTLKISQELWKRGFAITAIRPPTVPKNTSRLRITFNCSHEIAHLDQLLNALKESYDTLLSNSW